MKTTDIFKKKRVFSFEVFPPKRTMPIEKIYDTLDELAVLKPDFISVTYGAGGSASAYTIEIASKIKHDLKTESVAHLTCLYLSEEEAREVLSRIEENGIENVLALRGDSSPDFEPKNRFCYASDLISFIKENNPNLNILGACYPEGHSESPNKIDDLRCLKKKTDAGASHLVSQLFFDNSLFFDFAEKARIAGIEAPIEAGIMPVVNKKQIERMVSLCGASLPEKFLKIMNRYEDNPEALRDAGIAYAVDQIVDLVTRGVDGIHLYTMNNAYIARRICEAVKTIIET
ncbi:MAG: methylenetetrahydrofolate reductase [NAD(P)H] [Ruminiclostridium sp.]|jgi:methylenetetrahydrofolate reductase (NADPH)|nr:methylenetetrahydrofolate reductase [NAD(P)H] [Ruminiclostridium sp.]